MYHLTLNGNVHLEIWMNLQRWVTEADNCYLHNMSNASLIYRLQIRY